MQALKDLAMKVKRIRSFEAMKALLSDKELQDFIVELNTTEQLFLGIDSEGEFLANIGGIYAKRTVEYKRRKGQPTDRVTLKDTGEFYESFAVIAGDDAFEIVANTMKADADLQDRWGNELLGLTSYNTSQLVRKMIPLLRIYVLEKLLR